MPASSLTRNTRKYSIVLDDEARALALVFWSPRIAQGAWLRVVARDAASFVSRVATAAVCLAFSAHLPLLFLCAGSFQVALCTRMRTRRMSAFGGPCFRLTVEYLPRWFESHHSAVSSFFFVLAFTGPTVDGKDGNGISRSGVSAPRRDAAPIGRSGATSAPQRRDV